MSTVSAAPTAQNEGLRILGTLVVGLSFLFAGWWMAREGWLDSAALFLMMFVTGFVGDRINRGLIQAPDVFGKKLPETPAEMAGSFKKIRWAALAVYEGLGEWRDKSPNLRPMIWCGIVAGLYVAAKLIVVNLLVAMTNPAMLVLVGGTVIGVFLAPSYFGGLIKKIKAEKTGGASQ